MSNRAWIILGIVAGVAVLSCACCGVGGFFFAVPKIREAADRTKRLNDLKVVGLAIIIFQDDKKRGPANIDELAPSLVDANVVALVRKGDIEVVWKAAMMKDQPGGASNVLVAWWARPETNGNRLVVFLDGHTEILTEQEFQQKSKALTK
jgi:hypothetical protein